MRSLSTSTLIVLSLGLGACGTGSTGFNQGLETVHQPVVSRTDYVIDLASGGAGLAPGERERLAGWFASMRIGYGDRISVDDQAAYGGANARDAVAQLAAEQGLMLADTAPVTAGEIPPGAVRVVVSRTRAEVPTCPDWGRGSTEMTGSNMSNYGCSVSTNLAAMVANPEDLIHGRDPAGANDASTSGRAIKQYRERKPSGDGDLKSETTSKGSN
ncbi:CpaD family pilus assembly protein [Sphingomonas flavalba]|uniref:CpaD family pilus assembly protein n=1 Tax=Sphingomonas flavalba TaxID=2559804 RepID=UPI0039E1D74E